MDCIDLFKKAAAALQTDPRYLELDAARRENDSDEELQNLIGEFNLARLDLNNESAKAECEAMVSHIDAIINTAMNGGDPMTVQAPSGGCTGSCSTCGGCH